MPTTIRVLVVEDCEDDALLVAHELAHHGFETDWTRVQCERDLHDALEEQTFDVMDPANIAPTVVWLGSPQSAEVTGCVFELEGGKIMLEDGWREGPVVDKGDRWAPAEVGAAVEQLLAARVPPRKVWGTA